MARSKRQPTEEQKEKARERREHFSAICKQIGDMTEEQRAEMSARMGTLATCEGRTLSPHNSLLLACQMESATIVGGFHQWRHVGRTVRRGEHGLMIWVPKQEKASQGENEDQGQGSQDRPGFFMGTVFDISQTEPLEEPV